MEICFLSYLIPIHKHTHSKKRQKKAHIQESSGDQRSARGIKEGLNRARRGAERAAGDPVNQVPIRIVNSQIAAQPPLIHLVVHRDLPRRHQQRRIVIHSLLSLLLPLLLPHSSRSSRHGSKAREKYKKVAFFCL